MRYRILSGVLFLLVHCGHPAAAGVESVTHNYVNSFNLAHKEGDADQKDKYYRLITGNEDILETVKREYPATYTLIRLESTRRRLETMKFRYGEQPRTTGTADARPGETAADPSGLKSKKSAGINNRSLVSEFPNQGRPANRSTSGTSNSNIRTTNRETVQAFPNQERVRRFSNQKRLRQQR